MADFDRAGKVTRRTDTGAVLVNLTEGQFLSYKLSVKGAQGIFRFLCKDKQRFTERHFSDHPTAVYEWNWPGDAPLDSDSNEDLYALNMLFVAAIKYTLVIELRDKSGAVIKTIKDNDYESSAPGDSYSATLQTFAI